LIFADASRYFLRYFAFFRFAIYFFAASLMPPPRRFAVTPIFFHAICLRFDMLLYAFFTMTLFFILIR